MKEYQPSDERMWSEDQLRALIEDAVKGKKEPEHKPEPKKAAKGK